MTPDHPLDPSLADPSSELGCVHKVLTVTLNTIHATQLLAAIVGLSYAIAISFHKPDPQHGVAALIEIYSLILLVASCSGIMGTYRPNCRRLPLKISAKVAPLLAFVDCLVAFFLIVEKHSILRYLEEKQVQLFIPDWELHFMQNHAGTLCIIFILIAAVDALRFYMAIKLKEKLEEYDESVRSDMLQNHARDAAAARRTWESEPYSSQTRDGLTDPLISDQFHQGDISISSQRQSSFDESALSWWEDPEPEIVENSTSDENNSWNGGWMSRVFSSPSRQAPDSNRIDPAQENRSTSTSSVDFAPIDGDIETESSLWHEEPSERSKRGSEGPDLSWVNEETDL